MICPRIVPGGKKVINNTDVMGSYGRPGRYRTAFPFSINQQVVPILCGDFCPSRVPRVDLKEHNGI